MDVTFANPPGIWALLGLPLVLAIHFLQTASRKVTVSTLFLLEELEKENIGGRRWERLRNSVPLWLQLLAVLLLTWLLLQPRWLSPHSTMSTVVVLDSSVSMSAFRGELLDALPRRLAAISRTAAKTEWIVLESDTARGTLYAGAEMAALREALSRWKPRAAHHDPTPALRIGQSLLRNGGLLLFATDHRVEVPYGAELLAIGHPVENCGFAGLLVPTGEGTWKALVKNYSDTPQKRTWSIVAEGTTLAVEDIVLKPGEMQTLRGGFPPRAKSCELRLSADPFTIDDHLPILATEGKQLTVYVQSDTRTTPFYMQILRSGTGLTHDANEGQSDLRLLTANAATAAPPSGASIVFLENETVAPSPENRSAREVIVAEKGVLMDELNWQGLVAKETARFPSRPEDRTLLWGGDQSLIFVRGQGRDRQLVFNFELDQSNATRLPALIILLHRFLETVRAEKVWPEVKNVETNQLVNLAVDPVGEPLLVRFADGATITVPLAQSTALRAPPEPGRFEIAQGETKLLTAATYFADSREADFRNAQSFSTIGRRAGGLRLANSREDFLTPLWAVTLGGLMVGNWWWLGRKRG